MRSSLLTWLLLLASALSAHAQFVPMQGAVIQGYVFQISSCSTSPTTDTFAGSGALSNCWTQTTATLNGYVSLVQSSGKAVTTGGNGLGLATYTGATFTSTQYAQGAVTFGSNDRSGVCVNMSVGGNGICYFAGSNTVSGLTNGGVTGSIIGGCAAPTVGDTINLSVVGTVSLTVTDVTKGTVLCSTSTVPLYIGSPGIMVDQRTHSVSSVSNFQAN